MLLDGDEVTSAPDGHYRFVDSAQRPRPFQPHVPIMIGGSGERKTLRTVARYADLWNAMGSLELMTPQGRGPAANTAPIVGRDPSEIEFTLGLKVTIRDSEAEAVRVWQAAMEHNRTSLVRRRG